MSAKDLIVSRLKRQSTWSMLSVQLLALAAALPQAAPVLAPAAAICGIIKLFVPEDSTKGASDGSSG